MEITRSHPPYGGEYVVSHLLSQHISNVQICLCIEPHDRGVQSCIPGEIHILSWFDVVLAAHLNSTLIYMDKGAHLGQA